MRQVMHSCAAVFVLALLPALFAASAIAGESGTRAIASWSNVTTADGWVGRRYMDGSEIFAEEFDSNGDGRIDVWRFYRRGMLSSEERDLGSEGKVTYQSRWDAPQGRLVSVFRDTAGRGINDLEIESLNIRRWEVREDRNKDGVTDRILFVNGPPDLFETLGFDLARQSDVIASIPTEYWHEMWSDDSFTQSFTDYRRYSRGVLTHYGVWENGRIAWRRCPPDFEPPPAPPPQLAVTHGPNCTIPNCPEAVCRIEPSDAPITDVREDPGVYEPTGVFLDGTAGGQYPGEPYVDRGYVEIRTPAVSDRTRYDTLPPGESSARSVPARMRMPGVRNR